MMYKFVEHKISCNFYMNFFLVSLIYIPITHLKRCIYSVMIKITADLVKSKGKYIRERYKRKKTILTKYKAERIFLISYNQ